MTNQGESDRLALLARTCAGINLRRAARSVTNYYDKRFLAVCGFRMTQITPLVVLYLAGPQTVNEIAQRLGLDRTTLTRNLRPLEKARLLTIGPGADQRTRLATLTRHGTATLLKALPVWEEAQAHVVQGIGADRFRALLTQLGDVADLTRED